MSNREKKEERGKKSMAWSALFLMFALALPLGAYAEEVRYTTHIKKGGEKRA